MILLIDHFDSFIETLARYVREAGREARVVRADRFAGPHEVPEAVRGVILSPGPGQPADTPATTALFAARPELPILGICLGHQALAEAYGGATIASPEPLHGRQSHILHDGDALFAGVPSPFGAGRYHSLLAGIPEGAPLRTIARTARGKLPMAARHLRRPHMGMQFHPESVLTPDGRRMIGNFLEMTERRTP